VGARPLGAASAVYGAAPWAFSAADAWKVASPTHMGIMHLRYEGSFSLPRPAGSFALRFYQSTAIFRKALLQSATGSVWS